MTTPINHPPTRAQRLVDEFQEGASWGGGFNLRRGLAWVLRHIADTEGDPVVEGVVPVYKLQNLADALDAPSLLDRAMAGDAAAARQFLREAGFTDGSGNWLPQYQTPQETDD